MVFRKKSRTQEKKFKIDGNIIQYTAEYKYLGIVISHTGNLSKAVGELREKARRALYAIKRKIQFDIPIQTWLKIFKSAIEPIALYDSEVWGPKTKFSNLGEAPSGDPACRVL